MSPGALSTVRSSSCSKRKRSRRKLAARFKAALRGLWATLRVINVCRLDSSFMFMAPDSAHCECFAVVHRDSFRDTIKTPALRARKADVRARAPASNAGIRAGGGLLRGKDLTGRFDFQVRGQGLEVGD